MATNYAHASYNEVVDMQTVDGKTTIIGIHTPVGHQPYIKLKGFFTQFRKFRYKGISRITFQPASGLPIDPLGLSVQVGSTEAMNPKDTFNPILFKGCHGEHILSALDKFMNDREYVAGYGFPYDAENNGNGSATLRKVEFDNLIDSNYYNLLTDVTWKKFGVQSPFTLRNLHPLVWKMATNMPMLPGIDEDGYITNTGEERITTQSGSNYDSPATTSWPISARASGAIGSQPAVNNDADNHPISAYKQEFTNGCARLGWMPTTVHVQGESTPKVTMLPKLFMGLLVLPPSYSCEQFLRCVIRHEFEFSGFTTSSGAMDPIVDVPSFAPVVKNTCTYFDWIDSITSKDSSFDVINGKTEVISDGVA